MTRINNQINEVMLCKNDFENCRGENLIFLESFNTHRPILDVERAKYFTESMKETEGEPLVLRWSKALLHIAKNMTVYIDDDNLLVGRGGQPGRYGMLFPELDGDFLDVAIEQLPSRVESPFNISQADADIVINEIAPYWKGKTFHENLTKALPKETLKTPMVLKNPLYSIFIVNTTRICGYSIRKRCI